MSLRENLEKLPAACWENETVKIRPLSTQDDLIYAGFDCQLTEEQQDLVNPAWFSIGRAYLDRDHHYPCIICNAGGEPVGFINLSEWPECEDSESHYSWSFYIDYRQQGGGYGKSAARLAIRILRAVDPAMPIKLSTEVCNTRAQALYRALGFVQLDEMDGDDYVFGL